MLKINKCFVFFPMFFLGVQSQAVTIDGASKINSIVENYLKEIMLASGLDRLSVSRGSSSPAKQAQVMYDYYLRNGAPNCNKPDYQQRKACALYTYGPIGDAAINAISNWKNRSESIEAMTKIIEVEIERVGKYRNEMAHVPIPGRYAVDVRPSSVGNHAAFKKAVQKHGAVIVERFYWPGKVGGPAETAFHIEFRVE